MCRQIDGPINDRFPYGRDEADSLTPVAKPPIPQPSVPFPLSVLLLAIGDPLITKLARERGKKESQNGAIRLTDALQERGQWLAERHRISRGEKNGGLHRRLCSCASFEGGATCHRGIVGRDRNKAQG
ncbi:unnamed protein product [Vitrella brassicaformis CCMP3155]|uniref:Uncharacterized protein n=1 Tax=Vitrella brassicaformis (strain CCMP3155) TaxID=1169540 RepID=A0A0G4H4X3_VITBC|nr:unnamed protein product [Vitrella brassicaformis CCMP3155]|eukprot:CEM38841.1 unnamed protein product [Vitrella brassicaformis CCMP3155]